MIDIYYIKMITHKNHKTIIKHKFNSFKTKKNLGKKILGGLNMKINKNCVDSFYCSKRPIPKNIREYIEKLRRNSRLLFSNSLTHLTINNNMSYRSIKFPNSLTIFNLSFFSRFN